MISFHSMPRTFVHPFASDSTWKDVVEVEIPAGKTCRYLALGHDVAPAITVHLREDDAAGLPGALFEAQPLGPRPDMRGGYIGEHVGPMTLKFWLVGHSNYPMPVGGALCFEDTEEVIATTPTTAAEKGFSMPADEGSKRSLERSAEQRDASDWKP